MRTQVKITGQWKSMPFFISDIFSHEYPRTGSYAPKTPKGAGCIRKGGRYMKKEKKQYRLAHFMRLNRYQCVFADNLKFKSDDVVRCVFFLRG